MTPALQRLLLFHVVTSLWQHAPGSEIIYGQKAPANSLLYMVSLQDNYGTHRCGGSLINDNFVLTAAHCQSPGMPARVLLGTHNLRGGGTVRGIAQVFKHPSFRGVSTGDDIMLLKLSQKVPIGGRIQSIRLPPPNTHIRANQKCRVAGWGWSESTHDVDDLRFLDVPVIDKGVCKRQWDRWFGLPANVICAGSYRTLEGACHGDSGGPLVYNGMAVGIVSFGYPGCFNKTFPNVYTEVSKFRPWIDNILRNNGC